MVGPYVLVADADLQRAFSYRQMIADNGFEAVITRDGQDALRILERRGAPVLALADLSLPRVDGFAVIARLRSLAPADKAPVVAFSAFDEIRSYAHSRRIELGIAQVLSHGVPAASLRRTIQRLLDGVIVNGAGTQDPPSIEGALKAATAECLAAFAATGAIVSVKSGNREWIQCDLAGSGVAAEALHGDGSLFHSLMGGSDTFILPEQAPGGLLDDAGFQTIRIQGFVGVPLATDRTGVFGVLALIDAGTLQLDPYDLDALHAFGRRLAVRLERHIPMPEAAVRRQEESVLVEGDFLHRLAHLTLSDSLTGLANRRGGELAIQREVARTRREGTPLSFVLIDIDDFKRWNEEYGREAGDDVLRRLARIVGHAVRGSDLAVRWGGEEFLLVLPNVSASGALVVAERIRAEAESSGPDQRPLTVSAGVAELEPGENVGAVLARADDRLSQAKRAGRNQVVA